MKRRISRNDTEQVSLPRKLRGYQVEARFAKKLGPGEWRAKYRAGGSANSDPYVFPDPFATDAAAERAIRKYVQWQKVPEGDSKHTSGIVGRGTKQRYWLHKGDKIDIVSRWFHRDDRSADSGFGDGYEELYYAITGRDAYTDRHGPRRRRRTSRRR